MDQTEERGIDRAPVGPLRTDAFPDVSVIIPCRRVDRYVRDCVVGCLRLEGVQPEILVLPDSFSPDEVRDFPSEVSVIATGSVLPGAKRNLGTRRSSADIVAYIDADAYPKPDWLDKALPHLAKAEIGAVGGPGITPKEDGLVQRLSGEIYASPMMGRTNRIRYVPGREQEISDLHSCNFVAKKEVVLRAGGWSEAYWPGEDTLLCLAIARTGIKILYSPTVQVYHHRRSSFRAHLRQVWNFGLHRGFFFRHFPANSRRVLYAVPSMMLLYVTSIPLFWFAGFADVRIVTFPLFAYAGLVLVASLMASEKRLIPMVWAGIFASHLVYGGAFIKGFLSTDVSKAKDVNR